MRRLDPRAGTRVVVRCVVMQPEEYARLQAFEERYWWYRAQRRNLLDAVMKLRLPPGSWVLDAGCGTGRNLMELVDSLGVEGFGVDISPHAAASWNGHLAVHRCLGSLNELPYPDDAFDAVCSVDVLGCRGVVIDRALSEVARVLRPRGYLVLLVPAYHWLLSRHDEAVHSVHRFTRRELRERAARAGLTVVTATHRFPMLFPAIAVARMAGRLAGPSNRNRGRSDLGTLPSWINCSLVALCRAEFALVRRFSVPFGTTILLAARKEPI